jgi:hypothetical protein
MDTELTTNKKRGRPTTHDAKNNPSYFREYYHKTNPEIICECGAVYKKHSQYKHFLTGRHQKVIDLLKQLKEKNSSDAEKQELLQEEIET